MEKSIEMDKWSMDDLSKTYNKIKLKPSTSKVSISGSQKIVRRNSSLIGAGDMHTSTTARLFSTHPGLTAARITAGYKTKYASSETGSKQYISGISKKEIDSMAEEIGSKFITQRTNEKESLKGLNTRFASYINKVKQLQSINRELEKKLNSQKPANMDKVWEIETKKLRTEITNLANFKDRLELERSNLYTVSEKWHEKYEIEHRDNNEKDQQILDLKKKHDEDLMRQAELQRKLEAAIDEMSFNAKLHQEEIDSLKVDMANQENLIRDEYSTQQTDIMSELDKMREYYERLAEKSKADIDEWCNEKIFAAQEQSSIVRTNLNEAKEQISVLTKREKIALSEIENYRNNSEALARSISEIEDRHKLEIETITSSSKELQNKFEMLKSQMADQLRQYQELMHVKIALDLEISTYRNLLDGEENRIDEIQFSNLEDGSNWESESSYYRGGREFHQELITETSVEESKTVVSK